MTSLPLSSMTRDDAEAKVKGANGEMAIAASQEAYADITKAEKGLSEQLVNDEQRQAFAKRWLAKWAANGFVDENGAETKNLDLWMGLLDAIGRFDRVCFRWVKGHAGMPANELVDVLAGRARGETKTESWGSGGWVPATKFQLSNYWMGGEDG